jgi:hypothetical protein
MIRYAMPECTEQIVEARWELHTVCCHRPAAGAKLIAVRIISPHLTVLANEAGTEGKKPQ